MVCAGESPHSVSGLASFIIVPLGHCYCAQELFDCIVLKVPKQVIKIQTSDIGDVYLLLQCFPGTVTI